MVKYFMIRTIRAKEDGDNMIVVNTSSNELGFLKDSRGACP